MPVISAVAIYLIIWALCLFVVLPFGAHSQTDAGDVFRGSEPGAPAQFRIVRKLLATTLLAAVVMVLVMWGLSSPGLREYWR